MTLLFRMPLEAEFRNGPFGDPALRVRETNGPEALLIDCGDLSRFEPRELLSVTHLFVSHCHIDHFFAFDLLIRLLAGHERTFYIFGPPEISDRVAGKLQGYTWNLILGSSLEFVAVELDVSRGEKRTTRFHARDKFQATSFSTERWDPASPAFESGVYTVRAATLHHLTPSIAYSIEEAPQVSVDTHALRALGKSPGPWLKELKEGFLRGTLGDEDAALAAKVLCPKPRQKVVYATDGAANEKNKRALLKLLKNADLFFAETCFIESDRELADETCHFTAAFIGTLAREAKVARLVPFHFSKRYHERRSDVVDEVKAHFGSDVTELC